MNIYARLYPLPSKIKSFAVEDANGDYTIIINEYLNIDARFKAFSHEIDHIESHDFEGMSVNRIEWQEKERCNNEKKNEIAKRIRSDY